MIVVLADDLTGAAELGGLALRYKLNIEITTKINPGSEADILIVATDTRSLPRTQAESVIAAISGELAALRPSLLFKKIDSVLRGHVLAEINVLKDKLNLQKALLVPANPTLGRTIEDGIYLMNGSPVHFSSFSQDPEFPVSTSRVADMLGANDDPVHMLKPGAEMPEQGIVVGEAANTADLAAWCSRIDNTMLVAGAAEFFTAILASRSIQQAAEVADSKPVQTPTLVILGSPFRKGSLFLQDAFPPMSCITETMIREKRKSRPVLRRWMDEIVYNLRKYGKAVMAVDPEITGTHADALSIRALMGEAAAYISGKTAVGEYLIEGGSTAAAVIRQLGIETLYPQEELAPGVIRMQVKGNDFQITLKPGSYEWPAAIFSAGNAIPETAKRL